MSTAREALWEYGVPCAELWRKVGESDMPIVLRGFIDESKGGEKIPKLFSLSCLIANNASWPFLEWDWVGILDRKNQKLRAEGRQAISRFHASDFSNSFNEFEGWESDEKKDFVSEMIGVFSRYNFHVYSYDMPLQLLVKEIPETSPNPVGFAYVLLLQIIMQDICRNTLKVYPDGIVSLHHDRNYQYDAALQDAFNTLIADSRFKCRKQFSYITSEGWEHCIPLQPADFFAYENYKEGLRKWDIKPRDRRVSLELFLGLDTVRGRGAGFTEKTLKQLKKNMERLDEKTKYDLLCNARIRQVRQRDGSTPKDSSQRD